ncbi:AraC family transcriptional regulator [uncultured Agrobacterium sp.]|uniref:AraC family transcriptional regulator n=2 Tax=Agrobacterium TaxID=357 RepID=UPI0025EC477D|nr:AraC family transcriptional regulator [uncultured Agrobacterium sp.]
MAVVERLIWQIETDLHTDLSLTSLSERCEVNDHICAGSFNWPQACRSRATRAPAEYPRRHAPSLMVAIALDAGYGSHEAFTRAFAHCFGITPSALRSHRSITTLDLMEPFEMNKDMIVPVAAPRLEERGAMRVVGLGIDCAFGNTGAIPALWQAFNARENEVENAVPGALYGVCCMGDGAGNFRYIAGVEAKGSTSGMEHIDIPAHRYAVFTHSGHISDFAKTVYTIWNKALPDAGLNSAQAPDFERYDHRFDGRTGRGEVEIWIPIVS